VGWLGESFWVGIFLDGVGVGRGLWVHGNRMVKYV